MTSNRRSCQLGGSHRDRGQGRSDRERDPVEIANVALDRDRERHEEHRFGRDGHRRRRDIPINRHQQEIGAEVECHSDREGDRYRALTVDRDQDVLRDSIDITYRRKPDQYS